VREIDECLLAALARGEWQDAMAALDQGADANAIDDDGRSALRVACDDSRADTLVPALMRAGARLRKDVDGLDQLEACCASSNWIAACVLANAEEARVEPRHLDYPDQYGSRLPIAAAALGQIGLLRKLALIDPMIAYACDAKGFDAFWHACESGSSRSAEFLCSMATADKIYPDGSTRLHLASRVGSPPMVRSLIERGAAIRRIDGEGQSCMHHAALSGSLGTALALLSAGEPFDARDSHGRSPLELAILLRHHDIADLLRSCHERMELALLTPQAFEPRTAERMGSDGPQESDESGADGDQEQCREGKGKSGKRL
jgi:ankyrin repeat protein